MLINHWNGLEDRLEKLNTSHIHNHEGFVYLVKKLTTAFYFMRYLCVIVVNSYTPLCTTTAPSIYFLQYSLHVLEIWWFCFPVFIIVLATLHKKYVS